MRKIEKGENRKSADRKVTPGLSLLCVHSNVALLWYYAIIEEQEDCCLYVLNWRKRQNPWQNQRNSLNLNHFTRLWIDHECQCQRLKYDKIWCFNLNSPSRGKGLNQDSDRSSAFLPMFLCKSLTVSNRF